MPSVRVAAALVACVALFAPAAAWSAPGTFHSSDDLLNQIWDASVATALGNVSTPTNLDPRGCDISVPLVILDGPVRDRCPYIGDIAVTGRTLLAAGTNSLTVRAMIAWFASVQNRNGSIPASPIFDHGGVLVDYNAYWIEALYTYTLWTGDMSLLQSTFPNLSLLVDGYYQGILDSVGLIVGNDENYAGIRHDSLRVSYYDAQYVRALGLAATLADWDGNADRAAVWRDRAAALVAPFRSLFWDPDEGAFTDTPDDDDIHPLDGNVFALLAGIATPDQQRSVLGYIAGTLKRSEGDVVTDSPDFVSDMWNDDGTSAIYPFITYFELLAAENAGADDYALGLIRREWGYMLAEGPGTMWEAIDTRDGQALGPKPSVAHGWSTGAAPILTTKVLGVQPTSPGFATFTVTPHPGDVRSASGTVSTPHGPIQVSWTTSAGKPTISVTAPAGTTWTNDPSRPPAPVPTATAPVKVVKPVPAKVKAKTVKRKKHKPPRPKKAHS